MLLTQRQILEQDLNDVISSKVLLEEAHMTELRSSLEAASSSKQKWPGLQAPRSDTRAFRDIVNKYLDTAYDTGDSRKWCNVLGCWLSSASVKSAHIVPLSWKTKEMAHVFGSDEPPLTSKRNGLSLQTKIEEAFNNCWIAIVPVNSVESNPTEWKNCPPQHRGKRYHLLPGRVQSHTDRELWRWRDIDGRQLSFRN